MGELIGLEQLKEMVLKALGESDTAFFAILGHGEIKPVIQDGVQKWWKHEVEQKLGLTQ